MTVRNDTEHRVAGRLYLGPKGRQGHRLGLLYPVLLLALGVGAIALIIDNRTHLVDSGYQIEAMRSRLEQLEMRNRQLRLEISSLSELTEVDQYAARAGLRPPHASEIRFLHSGQATPVSAPTSTPPGAKAAEATP